MVEQTLTQRDAEKTFGKRRKDHDHERRERENPRERRIPGPKQRDDTAFHPPDEER